MNIPLEDKKLRTVVVFKEHGKGTSFFFHQSKMKGPKMNGDRLSVSSLSFLKVFTNKRLRN